MHMKNSYNLTSFLWNWVTFTLKSKVYWVSAVLNWAFMISFAFCYPVFKKTVGYFRKIIR